MRYRTTYIAVLLRIATSAAVLAEERPLRGSTAKAIADWQQVASVAKAPEAQAATNPATAWQQQVDGGAKTAEAKPAEAKPAIAARQGARPCERAEGFLEARDTVNRIKPHEVRDRKAFRS